ncbi:MAG: methyl-accepting chemotaxis protein [Meiothermus sp.]|nr:methyl-accepting chemotaxis protein [Meiothermus sp.]
MKRPVKLPKAPRAARPPKAEPKPRPERPAQASGPGVGGLRVWQKLALIPSTLLVLMVALAGVGIYGLGQLRYQLDNMYNFMLIPITTLADSRTQLSELRYNATRLSEAMPPGDRELLTEKMKKQFENFDLTLKRYREEWVTTKSPEFTATLKRLGQSELQVRELESLENLGSLYNGVQPMFQRVMEGSIPGPLITSLEFVQKEFNTLVEINNQFAVLSSQDAEATANQATWLMAGALAASIALGLFLTVLTTRQITGPVAKLTAASRRLAQGQFDLNLEVKSGDEMGQLAGVLQNAANQLRELVSAQEAERLKGQQLQDNVNKFLTVATEIAQGDFTKRGDVTDDVLGNVVDAINLMTEEVSYLLKDVQKAAVSVSSGAQQVNGLTDSIAQGAQAQAQEVQQVRERTLQAAETIRQMADRAGQSLQQAQQTLEAAQLGREAVLDTLAGMQDIRMEMQAIAENIRAFLVRSAEINTVAKTLEDFASQTNLLALNASFEAAGAGAAGKRFAVVAEEIRRLAESSARETGRVTALVQQIQTEIGAVVARTQDGVREVENSYRVANTADERLEEIARLAGRTTQAAEQISKLAEGQVAVVERVEEAVQKIAQTAQRSEAESAQGREAAEVMRRLSEQLSGNLGRFKLPG